MAGGDETIIGPSKTNSDDIVPTASSMGGAWGATADTYHVIPAANGLEFWVIHVEGA